jgi:phenylalanyl-tRNA synthetase beta chain
MRFPIAWLRRYVDLPADSDAIAAKLANLGFPIDGVERRPTITGVVVGRLDAVEKHPNADRLQVCTVDVAGPKKLTIATAATNVAAGQTIAVATIGAQLPHLKIEPRKMRGIDSEGMLISAGELALPEEWFEDGILQLDADTPLGVNAVDHFHLGDPVLDVDVTPNRVDALSMVGLARELAAAFGVPLREPDTVVATSGASDDVRVTIESVDCVRYVAQRVGNLTVRTGAAWMRILLALAGQRPINNLVDISNFVMLEVGQPLHFFDYAKIAGAHIIIRDPKPGEKLTTLDGVERELGPTALLIADERQATGLAGLMGGQVSEVSETTREIVIESANWSGPRIRRMSVALGLRTEASTRNEKNVPIALADLGAARAAALLAEPGVVVRAPQPYGMPPPAPPAIALPKGDVRRLLGFELGDAATTAALQSLGFAVADRGDAFAVMPPPWRSDILIAADLVEEVARVAGYDRLEGVLPVVAQQPLASTEFDREGELAQLLAALGYRECLTLSLQSAAIAERDRALGFEVPPVVEIRNPLSDDQRYLRYAMLHAHLGLIARDRAPRPYRTFEIGHVFADGTPEPSERSVATIVAATPPAGDPPWRSSAFLAMKSDLLALVRRATGRDASVERATGLHLHPGKTAALALDGKRLGIVGVVDPRLLRRYEIEDEVVAGVIELDALPPRTVVPFVAPSRFPAIERDLALIVDADLPAGDVIAALRKHEGVRQATVFDEYRGAQIDVAKKSLAARVTLQRDDATLTDAQADEIIAAILADLQSAFGAVLRR